MFTDYNIDDIFLFTEICKYQTLNDAAIGLRVTPSFATRFVQRMEETFKKPLIITTRDGFYPSFFGQAIINRFSIYKDLFDRDLTSTLSSIKDYKMTFKICVTALVAEYIVPQIVRISDDFPGIKFEFIQFTGDFYHLEEVYQAHFAIVGEHSKSEGNYTTLGNIEMINKSTAYYELLCTDQYIQNFGSPSNLEQLQEHARRIAQVGFNPLYVYLDNNEKRLLIDRPSVSTHGNRLSGLVRTHKYMGLCFRTPNFEDLISILPHYNFGYANGYLFENLPRTKHIAPEIKEIIKNNITLGIRQLLKA